jgi:Protein of unknown function (DUF2961)
MTNTPRRRRFLRSLCGAAALFTGKPDRAAQAEGAQASNQMTLPAYARAQTYTTRKQSSYDKTGGNQDSWRIEPGQSLNVFDSPGPGIITHIWFTIDARSENHLKELVLRMYWEGNSKPSVEAPIGDFFGLNLGEYFLYQSAFLNCSSIKAMNCYFAMPFRRSARISVMNEGEKPVGSFYSNIDYQLVHGLPDDVLYFHAQYRQATPNQAVKFPSTKDEINLNGQQNYVFLETRGTGQVMGVTLGILQNSGAWFGEGDEMIFVDDDSKPAINGTGTEDYFCGAWDFGGRNGAVPFSNQYNGAPYIALAEHTGGRYCMYRWHADNPITFQRFLKYTIEHGHANDRGDCFYSVAYWYQSEPYLDMPPLPPVASRIPTLKITT